MIPSILCYVPPSVELLGHTIPQFSNPNPQPPVSNQTDVSEHQCHLQQRSYDQEIHKSCLIIIKSVINSCHIKGSPGLKNKFIQCLSKRKYSKVFKDHQIVTKVFKDHQIVTKNRMGPSPFCKLAP